MYFASWACSTHGIGAVVRIRRASMVTFVPHVLACCAFAALFHVNVVFSRTKIFTVTTIPLTGDVIALLLCIRPSIGPGFANSFAVRSSW